MEEVKEMLHEFNKSLKEDMAEIKREIKNDIKEIREDIKDMKKEIQKSKEEMGSMVEEITQVKAEWDKEKEAVYSRIKEAEDRMEKIERQKIRNNLLITGITMDAQNDSILEEAMEKMIEQELMLKTKIKKAHKIGQERCIVEMAEWGDKVKILKEKAKLRGKDIFIEADLTKHEQKIQKHMRDVAREEKKKGNVVKVGYQ
uniref:Uncharacterized protein PF11_0207-like n=1 Tax=Diabrotica virgifera virgifera TaxID=50390 RepID=A0A6P7FZJ9_DIAVI